MPRNKSRNKTGKIRKPVPPPGYAHKSKRDYDRNAEKKKQRDEMREIIKDGVSKLFESNGFVTCRLKEKDEMRAEVDEMRAEIEEMRAEIEDLKKSIYKMDDNISELEKDLDYA